MKFIYRNVFFLPLYNLLVWFSAVLPGNDLGFAIILLTLLVKLILLPLQHRMSRTQRALQQIAPALSEIKEKHAKDQAEQARATMALYREHGINPFSGFILLLIQIPIFIALYAVFRGSVSINSDFLYSFITPPTQSNHIFLGVIDLTSKSYLFAILAGVTQFIQTRLALPSTSSEKSGTNKPNIREELAKSMNMQMRYVLPVMIVFFSLALPSALSLYWIVGNLFTITHELVVRKNLLKSRPQEITTRD